MVSHLPLPIWELLSFFAGLLTFKVLSGSCQLATVRLVFVFSGPIKNGLTGRDQGRLDAQNQSGFFSPPPHRIPGSGSPLQRPEERK